MKKLLMLACSAALLFSCQDKTQNIKIDINKTETAMEKQNIYQFKVEDLSGKHLISPL
jgi:glutathione peroxidase